MIEIYDIIFGDKYIAEDILEYIIKYGGIDKYTYCALTGQLIPEDKKYQYIGTIVYTDKDVSHIVRHKNGYRIK